MYELTALVTFSPGNLPYLPAYDERTLSFVIRNCPSKFAVAFCELLNAGNNPPLLFSTWFRETSR